MTATRVIVSTIPPCDLNPDHGPAYADAKIPPAGPWGNLCRACFHAYGCELGTGAGQILILRGEA